MENTKNRLSWILMTSDELRRIATLGADAITHVIELTRLDTVMVKSRLSVILARIVRELHGTACVDLDHALAPKQEIASIRQAGLDEAVRQTS